MKAAVTTVTTDNDRYACARSAGPTTQPLEVRSAQSAGPTDRPWARSAHLWSATGIRGVRFRNIDLFLAPPVLPRPPAHAGCDLPSASDPRCRARRELSGNVRATLRLKGSGRPGAFECHIPLRKTPLASPSSSHHCTLARSCGPSRTRSRATTRLTCLRALFSCLRRAGGQDQLSCIHYGGAAEVLRAAFHC